MRAFALWSVMALLCFKKETRNELTGLLWQQDAELAQERKTKVYYDLGKALNCHFRWSLVFKFIFCSQRASPHTEVLQLISGWASCKKWLFTLFLVKASWNFPDFCLLSVPLAARGY